MHTQIIIAAHINDMHKYIDFVLSHSFYISRDVHIKTFYITYHSFVNLKLILNIE